VHSNQTDLDSSLGVEQFKARYPCLDAGYSSDGSEAVLAASNAHFIHSRNEIG
jgi:hypothetical protein